jgi:hypothetical protein
MKRIVTLLILSCAAHLLGQATAQKHTVESANATDFPGQQYIDVNFNDKLLQKGSEDVRQDNVTLSVPSNATLLVNTVQRLGGRPRSLRIQFSGVLAKSDATVHFCFKSLHFDGDTPANATQNLCADANVINSGNLATEKANVLDTLKKVPVSDQERNIFASGFVTTTSNSSQGGADLALNSPDLGIPGLTSFVRLKKSTTSGGDPKAFELGGTFKSTYLLHGNELDAVRSAPSTVAINDAIKKIQKRLLAAWSIDIGGKMEAEAGNFQVTNFVGDSSVYLQSRTKKLLGSRSGFWKFRILGTGFEGGKNVGQPNQQGTLASNAPPVDWIARHKAGAELTLFYDNPESQLPFKRVELSASGVNRYLFRNELVFNQSTSVSDIVQKGRKTWFESGLKLYLAESPKGRFGVNLSYNNGALPPVYASTKSFQFGFLVESADDTKK